MGEESLPAFPFDRTVEQAIVALKKGGHLLKCRRRGKPKFCPFKLSTDEKFLIWYSGLKEKQLRLSSVIKIIPGQRTVNFQRQLRPEMESQSFSLIYANGERSLDLICKDKAQADSWFVGLKAAISRCRCHRPSATLQNNRGAQTCFNSPVGYIRRKHNLGLLEDTDKYSQVHSLCGSPTQSLSERCFSDGLSHSSDSFYSSGSSLSNMKNIMDALIPNSPYIESDDLKMWESIYTTHDFRTKMSCQFVTPTYGSPQIEKNDILRDIMIWGEGMGGGYLVGGVKRISSHNTVQVDALLPKLLESTVMLDVQKISFGGKHAALVTKRGEVFCWGEGSRGRLGHKINIDVNYPKVVESLSGVHVKSVICGEYQTWALTHSGELYRWGDDGADFCGKERNSFQGLPHKLSGPLDGISISNVACGEWHTAIVSTSGQLFTYGDGTFGVLGHGNLQSLTQPKEVESLKGLWVKSVACGPWHTAAIVEIVSDHFKFNTAGGKLFTWGDGDKGRLGHADQEKKLLPTCVAQLVDHHFIQVSCGNMVTVGLTNSGTVYTMGCSAHGQLGNPLAKDKSITIVEGNLKEEFVREISSGSYHIAALTSRGLVYTWGKGAHGRLGLGDIEDKHSPTLVETLRDRQVESVACGSSFTAAICLHKSITIEDQSACSRCKMAFGLTRKKHNCYNCGLQFCGACSSKKILSASLAPNKSKPFRVCDLCFNHLQSITHSSRQLKLENHSPRQPLTKQMALSNEKEDRREVTPMHGQLFPVGQSGNEESQCNERNPFKYKGESQQYLEPISSSTDGLQRWGQVPCPVLFEIYCGENPASQAPFFKNELASVPSVSFLKTPPRSKSAISNSMNVKESLSESDKILAEEVQRLRAEVGSLEQQCRVRSDKIEECQQRTEEAWSLARKEAAKCKAAKEVIRALTLRLHVMSEKRRAGREALVEPDVKLPRTPTSNPAHLTHEVVLLKGRHADSLCNSPLVFPDTLKSIYGKDMCYDKATSIEDSCVIDPMQDGTKVKKVEWVEQYEPGVYITFLTLAGGQKGLKRVRFSRKKFTEKEAEQWWEENQRNVYQKYDIEGYTSSS
ncbi:PH, RCC1 and FYVE domains-containing protein 1 [Malania oleifera]|uniref:PH, RCC1 and FYVE domains-containing protein 1 n=1 Tax=Malania oleifera TaxID=397392 RepID=UPI0025AD9EB3|nr:PH, RCC1 and FYVE domains-containing protein 1 [Malania oleifera]